MFSELAFQAKLSNVLRIDKFTDAEILLLDEHEIDLPKAARLAMLTEEIRLNCMNSDFLSSLAKSERPLSDIWRRLSHSSMMILRCLQYSRKKNT